ncbi:MAG: hypothetical protein R2882_06205 [Gemmatimonadales bacterium]
MSLRVAGLVVALGAIASAAAAQSAQSATPKPVVRSAAIPADAPVYSRQGTWFGAGVGAGSGSLHCSICDSDVGSRGTGGYLRAGTTVSPRLLVGAELNGWMRSDEAGHQRVVALTGNGYWYPNPRHGYYFKAGFGVSQYRQWNQDGNNDEVTVGLNGGGFTGQVGVGYEVRVNPKTSFVPYFNIVGSAKGRLATTRDDGTSFERNKLPNGANVLLLQLGLGVTWH